MIDLDILRKAKGYVLAIVNENTGEYTPVSGDVVQVIRCKNCTKKELCSIFRDARQEFGFCAWAGRKEE